MTYKKAEIRVLGEAASVIQDFTKSTPAEADSITGERLLVHPAYDLDE